MTVDVVVVVVLIDVVVVLVKWVAVVPAVSLALAQLTFFLVHWARANHVK